MILHNHRLENNKILHSLNQLGMSFGEISTYILRKEKEAYSLESPGKS
jgi:hypothetical protein